MQSIELPQKPPWRIERSTAFAMVATAIFYDALQMGLSMLLPVGIGSMAIPIVGIFIGVGVLVVGFVISLCVFLFAFLTFFIWFNAHNVSLGLIDRFAIKRFLVWVFTALAELFLSFLPGTTIGVIATIVIVTEEDRQKRLAWEGHLSQFEKYAWALLKSGGNPRVLILRALREASIKGKERMRLQHIARASQMHSAAAGDNQRSVDEEANDSEPRRSTAPLHTTATQSPYATPHAA